MSSLLAQNAVRLPTEWRWDCVGLCSGHVGLDLAAFVLGAALLAALVRIRSRYRSAGGVGKPGRVALAGLGAVLGALPFLAFAWQRVCTGDVLGLRVSCVNQVMVVPLVHGVALIVVAAAVIGLSRDLRPAREQADLAPPSPRHRRPRYER